MSREWTPAEALGPYRLVEFRTGDVIRAELNPTYHVPNRPYFDRLEIKCGGDAACGTARRAMRPQSPITTTWATTSTA